MTGGEAGQEDAVGASARAGAGGVRRGVEQGEDHGHDLGLHLSDAGKDVGVDGVGDGELAVGLGLQADEVVLTVVDGAGYVAVLPARVVHVGQGVELLAYGVLGPGLLGEGQVARPVGGHHLGLELGDGFVDLLAHLGAHAWHAQEVAVEHAADVTVELGDGAEEAAALELPEDASGPSHEEEEEDDVSDAGKRWLAMGDGKEGQRRTDPG